jgi:hypothetical protein
VKPFLTACDLLHMISWSNTYPEAIFTNLVHLTCFCP